MTTAKPTSSPVKRRTDDDATSGKKSSKKQRSSSSVTLDYKGDGSSVGAILIESPYFRPPEAMNLFSLNTKTPTLDDSLTVGVRPDSAPNVVIDSDNYNLAYANTPELVNQAKGYTGQYVLGIYDAARRKVTLHPAPLLSLSRSIVLGNTGPSRSLEIRSNFASARRDLGELFGNRKQKLAIRNADRMKVDTAGIDEKVLQGIKDAVADARTNPSALNEKSLPSHSILNEDLSTRPIPLPHLDATTPEAVYPLSELFPRELSLCINSKPYLEANDADQVQKLLPQQVSRSQWLTSRLWLRVQTSKKSATFDTVSGSSGILKTPSNHQRQQMKLLLYIALLWSLRVIATTSRSRGLNDRKSLREKLRLVPRTPKKEDGRETVADVSEPVRGKVEADTLLDAVLSRFCEKERGSDGRKPRYHLTAFCETKLLATIVVLCLHIDGFALDIESLASDMSLKPAKLNELAKSVGCTTRSRVVEDQGSPDDAAASGAGSRRHKKVMALKCPFKLPDGSRSGPPARK